MVTGGVLFLPLTREVLRGLVDALAAAPDELTAISFVMGLPPAPSCRPSSSGRPRSS